MGRIRVHQDYDYLPFDHGFLFIGPLRHAQSQPVPISSASTISADWTRWSRARSIGGFTSRRCQLQCGISTVPMAAIQMRFVG